MLLIDKIYEVKIKILDNHINNSKLFCVENNKMMRKEQNALHFKLYF